MKDANRKKYSTLGSKKRRNWIATIPYSIMVILASGFGYAQVKNADESGGGEVEEVIVTGLRASIQTAQELKRNAKTFVDSVVAEDIGKLPDRSITETLQRVPGVTMTKFLSLNDPEHFSAEGTGVAVRGLTYVRSELNGRAMFGASGGQAIGFEDVPAELMAGVDVYKNQSADMTEGGLAGTVNLRTWMPFDFKARKTSLSVSANYGDFSKETHPSYSGLISNRWDIALGEIGLLVDIAHSEISTRSDSIFVRPFFRRTDLLSDRDAWVSRGADWRSNIFNRERDGLYGALQWRPSEVAEFSLTLFNTQYDMRWSEDAIFVNNNPWTTQPLVDGVRDSEGNISVAPATFDANGAFTSGRLVDTGGGEGIPFGTDLMTSTRTSETTNYTFEAKWLPHERWSLNAGLQYSDSTSEAAQIVLGTGVDVPYMDVDLRQGLPVIGVDNDYLSDNSNYYFAFTQPHFENNEADQLELTLDAEYFFNAGPFKSIESGLRYTDTEAVNINTSYHWVAIFQPWMNGWALDPSLGIPKIQNTSMVHLNTFDNFYRGDAQLTGSVWTPNLDIATGFPDTFVDLYQSAYDQALAEGHTGYGNAGSYPYSPRDLNDRRWETVQEDTTTAVYIKANFEFDTVPVSGNIGVRAVSTDGSSSGYAILPGNGNEGDLVTTYFGSGYFYLSAERSKTHVLPSINIKWDITDDFLIRFAASKAIANPRFDQLLVYRALSTDRKDDVPDTVVDEEGNTVPYIPTRDDYNLSGNALGGNPNLEPMTAIQLDMSAEWYFSDAGSVHLNVFNKEIKDFIRTKFVEEEWGAGEQASIYRIEIPDNVGEADISGAEIGYSQFFSALPAPFDGFGVQANYTYIDSATDVQNDAMPIDTDGALISDEMPIEGISENAYNLVLMYEKFGWSARIAYNWRSEYLTHIGPNGFNGNSGGIDGDQGVSWALPVYADDIGQWDGSVSYDATEQIRIALQVNNITNEETKTFTEQASIGRYTTTHFVNDTRYSLVLSVGF